MSHSPTGNGWSDYDSSKNKPYNTLDTTTRKLNVLSNKAKIHKNYGSPLTQTATIKAITEGIESFKK